jgi:hypothetical protein
MSSKKRILWAQAPLAVVLAAAIAGCGTTSRATSSEVAPGPSTSARSIDVSWAQYFHDLPTLKGASDLVAEGTFVDIARSYTGPDGVPMTDFDFKVLKILDGGPVSSGDIVVQQTGGTEDGVREEDEDDPLFQIGDSAVLFLQKNPDPDAYRVAGGPSGRFPISGESVKAFAPDGLPVAPNTATSTFENHITQTVAKTVQRPTPALTTPAKVPAQPTLGTPGSIPSGKLSIAPSS